MFGNHIDGIRLRFGCVTAMLFFVTGCKSEVPTYPVQGKVIFKETGQEMTAPAMIWFESTKPPYTRAMGLIEKGQFYLSTNRDGSGAMEGEHRVRIDAAVPNADPGAVQRLAKVIDPRYFEFQTSGLKETINPGAENNFTIEVTKPKR